MSSPHLWWMASSPPQADVLGSVWLNLNARLFYYTTDKLAFAIRKIFVDAAAEIGKKTAERACLSTGSAIQIVFQQASPVQANVSQENQQHLYGFGSVAPYILRDESQFLEALNEPFETKRKPILCLLQDV